MIACFADNKKEQGASRQLETYTSFMKTTNSSIFNWAILFLGAWVILSPLLLGSVGTILFYSNIVVGTLIVIFAVKNIIGGKGIKI